MRGVVWIVLLFVVAVVAATVLGRNDGLVSLYWGGWRTDLSLNLFVMLVLGGCALLVLSAQAANSLTSLPRRAQGWRALRRERAAQAALRESLTEYFGARYGRARKAAQRALDLQRDTEALAADAQFRALAQLLMAGSLHRLQDRPRRDEMLQHLLHGVAVAGSGASPADAEAPWANVAPDAGAAVGSVPAVEEAARLLAAEWAVEDRDGPRALELLQSLSPGAGRRTQALRLRLQAARLMREPAEALRTARLLANHQAFSPVVAQSLLRALAGEAIDATRDRQQLQRLWSQLDPADRRDVPVAVRAAAQAVRMGAPEDARQWLRPFWDRLPELAREEREAVALALVDARADLGADWLPRLESALATAGHDGAVTAAVGMAFAERGLWGKARPLLMQAAAGAGLPARTRRAAWRELAALAREEGREDEAARCEREAAALD